MPLKEPTQFTWIFSQKSRYFSEFVTDFIDHFPMAFVTFKKWYLVLQEYMKENHQYDKL